MPVVRAAGALLAQALRLPSRPRHSINSLLAKRGVPPHIRALWLGHTPEVNQAVYTHASAADLAMVTSAIGEIYSAM